MHIMNRKITVSVPVIRCVDQWHQDSGGFLSSIAAQQARHSNETGKSPDEIKTVNVRTKGENILSNRFVF